MSAMGHPPGVRKWWPETDTRHPARVKGHGREAHCVGYLGQREKQEMRPSLQFPWFTQKLVYILPWRSYVGCLRTNTMSDNEAYRIYVEHKGFILHIRSLFTQMGGSQLSLSLKRHSMMFLSSCHIPRLKWLHKGFISISSKQVLSKVITISCTVWVFVKYFHPWCGIYCVAGAGRRLNYLSI